MASDYPSTRRSEETQTAYLILLIGGVAGGLLVLASAVSSWWWWEPLIKWLREGDRDKLWMPIAAVAGLLAGLGVMFAAFQSARKFERVDVTLRRVLYGYNTGLTLLLVLLLVVVVNVFVQIRYPLPFDATEGGFYSLGEKTKQYIAALDKPVEVYVLLDPSEDPAYPNMKTVLAQLQNLNPRYFHVEDLVAEGSNSSRIRDLRNRFKQFTPRPGLLVAFGDKPETNHSFISSSELSGMEMGESNRPRRQFNGEVRLMQELYFLAEDKRRPIVYLTQGHGEPDIADRGAEGLSDLVQRLTQANYEVRALRSEDPDPAKNAVPADAEVVLVLGPRRTMNDVIPALRRYMNPATEGARKGRMIVMFGPTGPDRQRGGQMVETGLEPMLREYGVNATNERILMYRGLGGEVVVRGGQPLPESVIVTVPQSATESRHPLAMMAQNEQLRWDDLRRLDVLQGGPPTLRAEPLISTECFVWLESNMTESSLKTWAQVRAGDAEARARIQRDPLPVLVSVSETAPNADPHAAAMPNQGRTPRMLVFGCSTIATNDRQNPRMAGIDFDLVRGSIDWCRERYTNIGVEPKSYQYFTLPKQTSYWNLFYLPAVGMVLAVLGLGLVVWNIRRQ